MRDECLGPGAPLSAEQRAIFEARLGHDFSRVRVHADDAAAASARARSAKAYARKEEIVFAAGQYRPETAQGRRLLAHELAHVAQQQSGGSANPAQAERAARAAADQAAAGGRVSAEALGGAPQSLYCEPDDDKKNPEDAAPGSVLPRSPNLTLSTLPPIDWLKMQQSFGSRGQKLTLRDSDDMMKEWARGSAMLDFLGIDDRFKFWFITKDWILNKGLSMQLEDWQSRENPNAMDRLNRDWKNANPGGWETPSVPVFDIDWFRSKKKKK